MTIGDYPEYLALGFLRNQNMLRDETVTGVDYDDEVETVVVRTDGSDAARRETGQEDPHLGLRGGHGVRRHDGGARRADSCRHRAAHQLALRAGRGDQPHAVALPHGRGDPRHRAVPQDRPLVYMEDVGRHNAVDKIAGWMLSEGVEGEDKILYTTGRLTSEMVIKTALMGIPVLASRSGFTAAGVDIARDVGLTLIGRMRGRRFTCLSGEERLVRDTDPARRRGRPQAPPERAAQ